MKKFILCAMLCALFFTANSQTVDTAGVSKDVKYLTQTLSQGVQNVAQDLHIMPEQVYNVMQQQVAVETYWAHLWIWISIIVIIVLVAGGIVLNHFAIKNKWDEVILGMLWTLIIVISFVLTVVLICNYSNIIQLEMNPQCWIYKQLLPC